MVSRCLLVCSTPGFTPLWLASKGAVDDMPELPKARMVSGGTRMAKILGMLRLTSGKPAFAASRNLPARCHE